MDAGGIKLFVVITEHTKIKLSQGLKSGKMSSACLICVDYKQFIFVLACVDLKVRKTHTHMQQTYKVWIIETDQARFVFSVRKSAG